MSSPDIFNMNQMGSMPSGGSNFSAGDLASIIHGVGKGASNVLGSQTSNVRSRADAREARRRTQARLLNAALRRQQNQFQNANEFQNELGDQKNSIMQDVARGFVHSLQGVTRR